jgi:DNA-binding IclR family transcriptional regulator
MGNPIELTMLVLSAICVADTDGTPMTAGDVAFLLDLPREETDLSLQELVADGSIRLDGDCYRMKRPLTGAQLAKMEDLSSQMKELLPLMDDIPVRLNS